MGEITGYHGNVDMAGIVDSDSGWQTYSWSLDVAADTHDVTNFTSTGWKKQLAGLKGWTGSVELYIQSDTSLRIMPSDVSQEITCRFYIDSTTGLTGKAIINSWNPAMAVDGVATQSLGIQGSSDLSSF